MKTLYLECHMGAAGDMLMAALLELHDDPSRFIGRLNEAGIPGVCVEALPSSKCGITGTHVMVKVNDMEEESVDVSRYAGDCSTHKDSPVHEHDHDHGHHHGHGHSHIHDHDHSHEHDNDYGHSHVHGDEVTHSIGHTHSGMHDIGHIINSLQVSDRVKKDALAVYGLIAEAESHAHGVPVDQIHFHEVGAMDAVADIVGVCMLMEELAPGAVWASPVQVGSGQVRCQHGVLPVPAPATAHILRGVPIVGGTVKGELCTPTGAALLKYFVQDFAAMPAMTVDKIGYGMGKKDFEAANCVRAFMGTVAESGGEVFELVCNLDDMTPEAVAFAQQLLLEEGALDVYTAPIGMKKGRTGVLFTCMCGLERKEKMIGLLFKHTTTLGVREYVSRRYTLCREIQEAATPYGPVRVKTSSGYGIKKSKPEFDDISRIARENGLTFNEAAKELVR